jgi:hypothetical protein
VVVARAVRLAQRELDLPARHIRPPLRQRRPDDVVARGLRHEEESGRKLDGAELSGRTLRVKASRPRASRDKPVWFEAQQWFEGLKDGEGGGDGGGDGADAAPKAQ